MKKIAAALLLSTAVAAPAFAADSAFYAAFDIGQSNAKDACNGIPAGVSCKKTDTAVRLAGGYQFTPIWGAEISYADLGKARASGLILGIPVSVDSKSNSVQLAATGTFPISGGFSILGKLGIARTEVKTSGSVLGIVVASAKATSTKAAYGIGAQYDFTKNVSVRAQYEDLGTVGDANTTGASKLTLVSAGLVFKF
ncbi:hypothetical protein FGKAn22_02150 [Ferrigenium kumadai]|uniref:Outer membrane protein beta-barrel domain-containing protein n=1 Tax=Ferrigenium kumadai TaxID=1682490 RepID=A0AAN1VZS4_9PROT|nr:outer membrane beta-barrel protein [Ferrigenium kumadai]BBI98522.1 hypothetical protein FGKAn22_02150 [Ferrigenium kumadai]